MRLRVLVATGVGLLLAGTTMTRASHWPECHFEVVVVEAGEAQVTLELERVIGADGSGGIKEEDTHDFLSSGSPINSTGCRGSRDSV